MAVQNSVSFRKSRWIDDFLRRLHADMFLMLQFCQKRSASTHSFAESVSFTEVLHFTRSSAIVFDSSREPHPASFCSFSAVLVHVVPGLPLLHFPSSASLLRCYNHYCDLASGCDQSVFTYNTSLPHSSDSCFVFFPTVRQYWHDLTTQFNTKSWKWSIDINWVEQLVPFINR